MSFRDKPSAKIRAPLAFIAMIFATASLSSCSGGLSSTSAGGVSTTLWGTTVMSATGTSFDVQAAFTGDSNGNSTATLYYCDNTTTPGCDPLTGTSVAMTRGSNVFTANVTGLAAPINPNDTLNLKVVASDSDGVANSPSTGTVMLTSGVAIPTFVKSYWCKDGGTLRTSYTCSFVPAYAGDTLLVHCFDDDSTASLSVTDNLFSTYSTDATESYSGYTKEILARLSNIPGGITSVKCTKSGSAATLNVMVSEYSGISTSSPVDEEKLGYGTSANPTTATGTATNNANDLIVGAFSENNGTDHTLTAGTNYVLREGSGLGSSVYTSGLEDMSVAATSTYQGAFNYSDTTGRWSALMVAYKANTGQWPTPIVQKNVESNLTTAATSMTIPFTANNQAGDFIAVGVRVSGTGRTLTITDTLGNTYNQAATVTQAADGHQIWIYYAMNVAAGANAVTVSWTGTSTSNAKAYIAEYAGVATAGALDQTSTSTGSDNAPTSGTTAATASARELLIGMFGLSAPSGSNVFTVGSGYTWEGVTFDTTPALDSAWEDKIVSTTGAYSATGSLDAVHNWSGAIATFKLQ